MRLVDPDLPPSIERIQSEFEDYDSLVMEACEVLARAGYGFSVSGFGKGSWPVDVSYDLSTVIEQLPALLERLRRGKDAEVDLYGQGVERTVEFAFVGTAVEARCLSRTAWQPDPATELLDPSELSAMLTDLARNFARALRRVAPELARREPFPAWMAAGTGSTLRCAAPPPANHNGVAGE